MLAEGLGAGLEPVLPLMRIKIATLEMILVSWIVFY